MLITQDGKDTPEGGDELQVHALVGGRLGDGHLIDGPSCRRTAPTMRTSLAGR